jgi:hypothetical protein
MAEWVQQKEEDRRAENVMSDGNSRRAVHQRDDGRPHEIASSDRVVELRVSGVLVKIVRGVTDGEELLRAAGDSNDIEES